MLFKTKFCLESSILCSSVDFAPTNELAVCSAYEDGQVALWEYTPQNTSAESSKIIAKGKPIGDRPVSYARFANSTVLVLRSGDSFFKVDASQAEMKVLLEVKSKNLFSKGAGLSVLALQVYQQESLSKRYMAMASGIGEVVMFDLEADKIENTIMLETKPLSLEWVGISGAVICADSVGELHLLL